MKSALRTYWAWFLAQFSDSLLTAGEFGTGLPFLPCGALPTVRSFEGKGEFHVPEE